MFKLALLAGDLARADAALAESSRATFAAPSGAALNEPVSLAYAHVAALRGDAAGARAHAESALEYLRAGHWTPRQLPSVNLATARAYAYTGRAEKAVRDATAAFREIDAIDKRDAALARDTLGQIHLVLGRKEEALAQLRELMSGLSIRGPNEIRHDPLWSRLQDDPRFEEILKSAKPL